MDSWMGTQGGVIFGSGVMSDRKLMNRHADQCDSCGARESHKIPQAIKSEHTRPIALMILGGLSNPCDIANALNISHLDVRHYLRNDPVPLINPVKCLRCRAKIKLVPCITCRNNNRIPSYSEVA